MSLTDLGSAGVPRSPDIQFMKGAYELGATSVPYFSATIPAERLVELGRLPSQLPFNPDRPLELEELFQRELNEERVKTEIVPYLRNHHRLRFFNALTIVLLPLDPDNPARLAEEYGEVGEAAPPSNHPSLQDTVVGPLLFSHPEDDDTVGYLCWNTDLVAPVLLDGQHRFWALKQIINEPSGPLRGSLGKSAIPVMLLVLDPRVGFKSSPGDGMSVLAACREIFIDLNKHAEKVSLVRQLMLDDRDLGAVTMRALIAHTVDREEIDLSVSDRVAKTGRIPLALVDWRSDSAKIDSGPYLTSARLLHDLVSDILAVPRFGPQDYDQARDSTERLDTRLGLTKRGEIDRGQVKDRINKAEEAQVPYEWPRDLIFAAGHAFRDVFGPDILIPLTKLDPYVELVRAYEDAELLASDLEAWFSLDAAGRSSLAAELGVEDPEDEVAELARGVKERTPLAFQVVFQKALVKAFHAFSGASETVAQYWKMPESDDFTQYCDEWIRRANLYIVPGMKLKGAESAFQATGIKLDGQIDYRKTRIDGIVGFIQFAILAPFDEWIEMHAEDRLTSQDIEEWLTEKWALISPGAKPAADQLFSTAGSSWKRRVYEFVELKHAAKDDGSEFTEDMRNEAALAHGTLQLHRLLRAAAEG